MTEDQTEPIRWASNKIAHGWRVADNTQDAGEWEAGVVISGERVAKLILREKLVANFQGSLDLDPYGNGLYEADERGHMLERIRVEQIRHASDTWQSEYLERLAEVFEHALREPGTGTAVYYAGP